MTDYRDRIASVFFTNLPSFPDAQCANVTDPDLFFPHSTDEDTTAFAKEYCRGCKHRVECLTYALTYEVDHGIFGGTTPEERKHLKTRKDRRKKPPFNFGGAA